MPPLEVVCLYTFVDACLQYLCRVQYTDCSFGGGGSREALYAWAVLFHQEPGWEFLTGSLMRSENLASS